MFKIEILNALWFKKQNIMFAFIVSYGFNGFWYVWHWFTCSFFNRLYLIISNNGRQKKNGD